jgi:siroheme synthase
MAAGDAARVRDELIGAGLRADALVVVAENVSLDLKTHTGVLRNLPLLAARCAGGPALLLIGEVLAAISTKAVDISVDSRLYTA